MYNLGAVRRGWRGVSDAAAVRIDDEGGAGVVGQGHWSVAVIWVVVVKMKFHRE